MANLVYVGRRGFIKDTENGVNHVWVGRRGFHKERAVPAGGTTPKGPLGLPFYGSLGGPLT